jgi:hypothetical protein
MSEDNNTNTPSEAPINSAITDPDPKINGDAPLADTQGQPETSALALQHGIEQPSTITDESKTQLLEYKQELRVVNRRRKKQVEGAVDELLVMGDIIIKVKKIVGHGYLKQWINDNCEFSYETARLAVRLTKAVNAGKLKKQTICLLGLKGAEKVVREQLEESERPGRHGSSKSLKQSDKITISKGAGWTKPVNGEILEVSWTIPAPHDGTGPIPQPFQQIAYVWPRNVTRATGRMRAVTDTRYEHVFCRWQNDFRDGRSVRGDDYDALNINDSYRTWDHITEMLNRWSNKADPEKVQVLDHDPATLTMLSHMGKLVQVVEQLAAKKHEQRNARVEDLKQRFAQVKAEREEKEKLQQTTLITGKFKPKPEPEPT